MIPLEATPMIPEFTNVFPEDSTLIPLEVTPMILEFTNVFPEDNTLVPLEVAPVIMEFINAFPVDNTLIPLEVTSVITEFTDFSSKDSTPIHSEVNPVITEFIIIFSEDLPDELSPTRDTQNASELVSGASLPDPPPQRMDTAMHIERKEKVDELSLEIKQPCLVPINIYFYEDKFWSYIVTKDVGQIRDATIYGRPMSDNSMNANIEESHTLQFINFSTITVRQRGTFSQPLPIRSLDIITNVIGKLSCSFTIMHLIIPFDRGCDYC